MKTSITIIVVLVVVAALGGGWYWYSMGTQGTAPQTQAQATSTPQDDGTMVGENLILGLNNNPTVGNYLSAYNGMTVYTYSGDTTGVSNCTGTCATTWPPYTVDSASDINVSAATTGTVGTITRADGTLQVTYNGMPLYFFASDVNPGDTTGQGVGGFSVAQP